MASKYKRLTVGSVLKSKDKTKGDYIKLRGDIKEELLSAIARMDSEKGLSLMLESKQMQLDSVEKAAAEGKLKPEVVDTIKERINKIPPFVRFEIIMLVDRE